MESENITNLNIETLMSYSQCPCEYIDDYLAISKNLEHILVGNEQVRLNVFLILLCSNGLVQIELNEKTYLLKKMTCSSVFPARSSEKSWQARIIRLISFFSPHYFCTASSNSTRTHGKRFTRSSVIHKNISARRVTRYSSNTIR